MPVITAAGVVVRSKDQVLLVHRPKYDDWSFPKGKLDRGEHITACAVREVREETGLDVRLGLPLADQHYRVRPVDKRSVKLANKVVHYWAGRVVGDRDVSGYRPNAEIDEVRWVPLDEAATLLTHSRDRATLAEAAALPNRTRTLIVLRHAKARSREHWHPDDRLRPLLKLGEGQAERLAHVLAAYDITRLVSSSSTRCVQTLTPYAEACGRPVSTLDGLSEEDATPESVLISVDTLLASKKRAVLCTHRPVLPDVFSTLGLADPQLEPGQMLVVHHRRGEVLETETHQIG
ncbi:8-oxo-dGTP diphosphatase [Nocardioides daedukensis]|uniref:8-oxo-dGTP diphosphatase n=1 Tax=Nocardioides daedukensis TaxID=634462 RepID=A0A7Y9S374_9ACTN|nr:NUDIX hydrolase [Nocardioides daedukensis]NYG59717.1 8-oxo-dGTP diphosphatase [Nocardioides daedukensis]